MDNTHYVGTQAEGLGVNYTVSAYTTRLIHTVYCRNSRPIAFKVLFQRLLWPQRTIFSPPTELLSLFPFLESMKSDLICIHILFK